MGRVAAEVKYRERCELWRLKSFPEPLESADPPIGEVAGDIILDRLR